MLMTVYTQWFVWIIEFSPFDYWSENWWIRKTLELIKTYEIIWCVEWFVHPICTCIRLFLKHQLIFEMYWQPLTAPLYGEKQFTKHKLFYFIALGLYNRHQLIAIFCLNGWLHCSYIDIANSVHIPNATK